MCPSSWAATSAPMVVETVVSDRLAEYVPSHTAPRYAMPMMLPSSVRPDMR